PGSAFRDDELSAELLRLRVGAPREVLTRDAHRKTEVVLDLGARARLAARRARLQDQNVESLRRAVHGGGEAGGPGADDDQVAHARGIDRVVEPEAGGDLLIGRAPEHRGADTPDGHAGGS